MAIARGRDPRAILDETRAVAEAVGYRPDGELGKALARFEHAADAFERGACLFQGDAVADLPVGFAAWLRATDRLPADQR